MKRNLDGVDLQTLAQGRHTDGGGLSLLVKATGRRSWTWRGRVRGKRRDVGLGNIELVGLAEARAKAALQRAKSAKPTKSKTGRPDVKGGAPAPVDVESVVKATVQAMGAIAPPAAAAPATPAPPAGQMSFLAPAAPPVVAAPVGGPTLGELWLGYVELSRGSWSESTIHNWLSVHEHHLQPLADRPAAGIERRELLDLIQPLWSAKRPTARRTLQGLSKVFELGIARGELETNPTAGLLAVLPRGGHDVEHREAVPWPEAPGVLTEILAKSSATRHALAFLILTVARPTEALEADWGEIDLDAAEWTIPASRMKKRRQHRVPLSTLAVNIARVQDSRSGLVFPGRAGRATHDGRPSDSHAAHGPHRDSPRLALDIPRLVRRAARLR